jgi:predicted flap endonuclease-1-like 5' DNA nuclease
MQQNLWLWLLAAFLLGMLVEWLLEIFFLRKRLFLHVEHQPVLAKSIDHDAPATIPLERNDDDETPYTTACPQHLSDVKGIGSVYETRLYAAGIGSYWDLAHLSDDDLQQMLGLTNLQRERTNFPAIRADALRLAEESKSKGRKWSRHAPDDFEPLKGIGHMFEKRLYDAGICTYKALANATVEELAEICHAPARLKPDYALWIRQAKRLAAKPTRKKNA